jgi:tetratricopeptide (TPR) repeat protein
MTTASKLRESARALEQRGQWKEALEAYEHIARQLGEDETDLQVLNRIGDLHLRMGEEAAAVEAYRRAVEAYAGAGLVNNAIALCNKLLRSVPGRAEVYLRLGQLSAAQGFLADARRSFLHYAELTRRSGDMDSSFAALEEFADVCPEDTDVRRSLADQLLAHGRKEKALQQLRVLHGQFLAAVDLGGAEEIRRTILEIDPHADVSDLVPPAPRAPEPPSSMGGDPEPSAEAAVLDGLQGNTDFGEWPQPTGDEAAFPTADASDFGTADALPLLGAPFEAGPDPDATDTGDEEPFEPLPFLAGSPAAGAEISSEEESEDLRQRLRIAPDDADARERLVSLAAMHGDPGESRTVLDEAHRALAAEGRYADAADAVQALIALHPEEPAAYQKQVEYAFRGGDRDRLIRAYLDLGNHLRVSGLQEKARAVFQRVLDLDPDNGAARRAVVAGDPALTEDASEPLDPNRSAVTATAPPSPAAPAPQPPEPAAGGYIDLGALIFGEDEDGEPSTRFVVPEEEPSGDEDRDFAEMLARFKSKVAENIDVEDSKSHYDLGLAYKDMGLIDEAISQFQVALRGGANPLATLEVLGECFVDRGQHALAARVLERALHVGENEAELMGVYYLLARCKDTLGDATGAEEYYERVLAYDIRFRDAGGRLEALRSRG